MNLSGSIMLLTSTGLLWVFPKLFRGLSTLLPQVIRKVVKGFRGEVAVLIEIAFKKYNF